MSQCFILSCEAIMYSKNTYETKRAEWFVKNCISDSPETNKIMTYSEIAQLIETECKVVLSAAEAARMLKNITSTASVGVKCTIRRIQPTKDTEYLRIVIHGLFADGKIRMSRTSEMNRDDLWQLFEGYYPPRTCTNTVFKHRCMEILRECGVSDLMDVTYSRVDGRVKRLEKHFVNLEKAC